MPFGFVAVKRVTGRSLFAAHGPFGHIRGPQVPLFLYQTYKLCCLHSADNKFSPTGLQELSRPCAQPVNRRKLNSFAFFYNVCSIIVGSVCPIGNKMLMFLLLIR